MSDGYQLPDPWAADRERPGPPLSGCTLPGHVGCTVLECKPPADPDRPCYHPDFAAQVDVGRLGQDDPGNPTPGMPTAFVAEISLSCAACGEAFKFDGVPAGLSFDAPATDVAGTQLRAPVRPVSMPPRHRRIPKGPSGFHIRGWSPL